MGKRPKQSRQDLEDELVLKAMANGDRRQILDLLREEPLTTGMLGEQMPWLNRCTVMQHLGVLEGAGLVISRKEGRQRWNYLNVLPIKDIHDRWIGPYASQAVELLARLQRDLELPAAAGTTRRRARG